MVGFLIIRHCDSALSDLHVDAWLDGKNAPPLRSGSMPEKEEERVLLTILRRTDVARTDSDASVAAADAPRAPEQREHVPRPSGQVRVNCVPPA